MGKFFRTSDGADGQWLHPPALITALGALILLTPGCGKSNGLSAGEPKATFRIEVVRATFPTHQRLAQPTELRIKVRDADSKAIPDLAITVDSFGYRSKQPGLADPNRPIWTVNKPPPGSTVALTNTYRLGRLAPDKTREAVWKLQAVRAGTYTVKYKIAAGLTGKSKVLLPDGTAPEGAFVVTISRQPQSGKLGL